MLNFLRRSLLNAERGLLSSTAKSRRSVLKLDSLEDRITPAVKTWTAVSGGSWNTASNWSGGTLPGPGDDVVIPDLGAAGVNATITRTNGSSTVQSITCAERLTLSGGSITFSGGTQQLSVVGTLSITGVTLVNAILASGTSFNVAGTASVLDGVTVADGASFATAGTNVGINISNGLTVNGTVNMTAGGTFLSFNGGSQTVGGHGQIIAHQVGGGNTPALKIGQAGSTLTIGQGLTIRGGVSVGSTTVADTTVENFGTIQSDLSTLYSGIGYPNLNSTFINRPTGQIISEGASWLTIYAKSWTNQGHMTVDTGGSLQLGYFDCVWTPSDLGAITNNGGNVQFCGTLNNTGTTLDLDGNTCGIGNWSLSTLSNAIGIQGGTIRTANGIKLTVGEETIFDGVTIAAGSVIEAWSNIKIQNNLTLNGEINFLQGGYGIEFFGLTCVLSGNGIVHSFPDMWYDNRLWTYGTGATLTIGPDITLHGNFNIGSDLNFACSVINNGTIISDQVGDTQLGGTKTGSSFVNGPTGKIQLSGVGTLNLAGDSSSPSQGTWSNQGNITVNGKTVNLGGAFSASDIGNFVQTNSTINLAGTLDNTGHTLNLDGITGSWILPNQGTIKGGIVPTLPADKLLFEGGIFDGVTVNGNLDLSSALSLGNSSLNIRNGLVLNGKIILGNGTQLNFNATSYVITQSLTTQTSGEIIGRVVSDINMTGQPQTINISHGITIHGLNIDIGKLDTSLGGPWINHGTIRAETFDPSEYQYAITLGNVTNAADGVFETQNRGDLFFNTGSPNFSGGTLTGGTWRIGSNSRMFLQSCNITTINADVQFGGANALLYSDFNPTDALAGLTDIGPSGSLTLDNGSQVAVSNGLNVAGKVTVGQGSILTLSSPLNISTTGILQGSGTVAGNVSNSGQVRPGTPLGTLTIAGNYSQNNNGTLDIDIGGPNAGSQYDRLAITGNASFDGTLNVSMSNGFGPTVGQQYVPVTCGSQTGDFTTSNLPELNGAPLFSVTKNPNNITFTAIVTAPDLAATAVQVPPDYLTQGQPLKIPYTVTNLSGAMAQAPWTDRFYFSQDAFLDASDALVGSITHTTNLAQGLSYIDILDATVPSLSGGKYYLFMAVDTDNAILDQNRTNNIRLSNAQPLALNYDEQLLSLNQSRVGKLENANSLDRWTFSGNAGQVVKLAVEASDVANGVSFTLHGPNGVTVFSDMTSVAGLIPLPTTGLYQLDATSHGGAIGAYRFRLDLQAIPLTLGDPYLGSLSGTGFSQLFQLNVVEPTPLIIRVAGNSGASLSVFASTGSLPKRGDSEYQSEGIAAVQQLNIPLAPPGTMYVLVYADNLLVASDFTIVMDGNADPNADFVAISQVTPNRFTQDNRNVNIAIHGLGFQPGMQIELVPNSGTPRSTLTSTINFSSQASATFDLRNLPIGDYGVRVTLPSGATHTLSAAVHILPSAPGKLETRLILPSLLGRHAPATIYVEYANVGEGPLSAPILILQSADADNSDRPLLTLDKNLQGKSFGTSTIPAGFGNTVQILASGATLGILQPGETIKVPVYYAGLQKPWDFSDNKVELEIRIHDAEDPTPIDWAELNTTIKPDWIAPDAWPAVFANLREQIGSTWGDYVARLSHNATYLSRFEQRVSDIAELFGFEIRKAVGPNFGSILTSALDAAVPTTGLSLEFGRSFGNTITERHQIGPFGRGWEAAWQFTLEQLTDGTVVVHESANNMRRFLPDSRHLGSYLSQTGDSGVLTKLTGGTFELKETSGFKMRYRANGKLDYAQDVNGNRITASYTNNKLSSLTHSAGGSITITYNPVGLISSISDSAGHVTTYTYDATNTLLLSATGPAGTTTYSYSLGNGGARDYALLTITGPDGLVEHFNYDSRGRIVASYPDNNVQRLDYTYDADGQLTTTDSTGASQHIFSDHRGLVVRSEDALGHFIVYEYNDARQLVKSTDDLGRTTSYTRCDCGRPKTITDAYDRTILTFTLGGPNNAPTAFTDANGNKTQYGYDAVGNLTKTTYADGSFEQATYDSLGNLDITTNRRNQTIDRTVNAAGQVTHEARSDGTTIDYSYDARGRLHTAVNSQGTTTLTYDNADRLKRIEYPNGRWLQYTYDLAGRRTQILDHTGFATNYQYDAAGRLLRLRDASNALIVEYIYNAAGRLVRENKGNGTYTEYGYDALGRQTSIFNYAPDGTVNSKFLYSYDAAGRRATQTTSDGVWIYAYDLVDELTHATFVSTNPAISNQDLTYEYDALGNRTRTVINGSVTGFAANNLNQYTAAGATTFQYDLDGNLIQESGPDSVKHYTYDLQNRLIGVQTPQGTTQYEYDLLGNRAAVIHNGQRTEYLVDPLGLGTVVGEYDGAGVHQVGYSHGLGLEGGSGASGWGYYDFDALGSTAGLSGTTGNYLNQYAYDPFGKTLAKNESLANPFEFVGKWGVMSEANGLIFMRHRFYDQASGRFTAPDPLGLSGGDVNLYRYVGNDPIRMTDPSGFLGFEAPNEDAMAKLGCIVARRVLCQELCQGDLNTWDPNSKFYHPTDIWEHCQQQEDPKQQEDPDPAESLFSLDPCSGMEGGEGAGASSCHASPPPQLPPPPLPDPCAGMEGGEGAGAAPCHHGDIGASGAVAAIDPNEKLGAAGFGPEAYIDGTTAIPYRINFENLGPGTIPTPTNPATAPAQQVEVTDQLSSNLDWSTFQFTEFGFGDNIVVVQDHRTTFATTVGMTNNGTYFHVEVELSFDLSTGLVHAIFQSIDPTTTLPPDVLLGFLPPEDGTGIGKGYLAYMVQPKANLATGTQLRNIAEIRFDGQPIITTNQIDPQDFTAGTDPNKEALNTIDADAPTVTLDQTPATVNRRRIPVTWTGTDVCSGIVAYDVMVSTNGGEQVLWQEKTTATSGTYYGEAGHTYTFQVVAYDGAGHQTLSTMSSTSIATGAEVVLPNVSEDTKNGLGYTGKTLLNGWFTDVDGIKLQGVAVTGLSGAGTWQYSLNGMTWKNIGTVSEAKSLLLNDTQRLRFLPALDSVEPGTVSYKAWDRSFGTAGNFADTTTASNAFSALDESATVHVTPVNDRPVLNTSLTPALPALNLNETNPTGATVAALLSEASDVDSSAIGMAITKTTGKGAWQYSLDDGTTWVNVGIVAVTSAQLLTRQARLRFVPQTGFQGTATISFKAWDLSEGSIAVKAKKTTTNSFSTTNETAYVTVGNAAPDLVALAVPTFPSQNEDTTPSGTTIKALLGTTWSDPDEGAKKGIALFAVSGNGTWRYSVNGKQWLSVGEVRAESAILFGESTKVRFVPARDWTGTAYMQYRPWDQTLGMTGERANLSLGNQTAFGPIAQTATLEINPVNDSPVLKPAETPVLPALMGDETDPAGVMVSTLFGYADTDIDSGTLGIAVSTVRGYGNWQWSADGSAWHAIVLGTTKNLLPLLPTDFIRYVPTATRETATFNFRIWDGSQGIAGEPSLKPISTSLSVLTDSGFVSVGNTQPVLTDSIPSLTSINEVSKAPKGDDVRDLLKNAVTDSDTNNNIGMAVVDIQGDGTWQYTLDNKTWKNIENVIPAFSLLLANTAKVRFIPTLNWNGVATIDYRAWDGTVGLAGERANTTALGSTSFSSLTETATLFVTAVNDRPSLNSMTTLLPPVTLNNTNPSGTTVTALLNGTVSDSDGPSLGIAIIGFSGKGTWQFSTDGGTTWGAVGTVSAMSALLLNGTAQLRFVPAANFKGQATLRYRAWDGSIGVVGDHIAVGMATALSTTIDTASVVVGNTAPSL